MKRLWFLLDSLNTRTKLVALLLLVIVPYSGLLIYSTYDRYQLLKREAQAQTLNLAQAVAESQKGLIVHTLQLLEALADDEPIRSGDWARCKAMLPTFWGYFKQTYSNFHVADSGGTIVCSGRPLSSGVSVADRKDFQDVLASKQAVVGDLVVSRTSGLFSLIIRAPILDGRGQVVSVVSAQISAAQFSAAAATVPLPKQGELVIADRNGKIIVQQPQSADWSGSALPEGELVRAMLTSTDGIVEARGVDGSPRIFGVSTAGSVPGQGLHVAIGVPKSEIEEEVNRNLLRNVGTIALVIAMVLISAWFGVDALVLGKIKVLISTIQKLKEGETSARTGLRYGVDELSHIARAIDEAAEGLERLLNLLREQTIHDPLTSLYNRRFLDESLKQELGKAQRNGKPVGVIMIDIDHFKKINDTHGHGIGDAVLVAVAKALLDNVRTGDIVCRFGGEEFAIVLPGANLNITKGRAEALRSLVEQLNLEHLQAPVGRVTISLGAAVFPDHGTDEEALLRSADAALYAAKAGGRNRTAVAASDVSLA
jgi:diguanylate cyclase (GGDEF)-like protein